MAQEVVNSYPRAMTRSGLLRESDAAQNWGALRKGIKMGKAFVCMDRKCLPSRHYGCVRLQHATLVY
jgi:hypothetical protein